MELNIQTPEFAQEMVLAYKRTCVFAKLVGMVDTLVNGAVKWNATDMIGAILEVAVGMVSAKVIWDAFAILDGQEEIVLLSVVLEDSLVILIFVRAIHIQCQP